MWRVEAQKNVARSLARLPRGDRERIVAALDGMATNPFAGDVVKLKGQDGAFRRRIGAYRIIYLVDVAARRVEIVDVLRRRSTTY
jgi:mRNA interferase RelE/StbE